MSSKRRFGLFAPTLFVVSIFLVSGCVGGPDDSSGPAAGPSAPAEADENTGAIDGLILDEEARPIQGAQIGLLEANLLTTTDADGKFSYSRVEPGRYSLFAQKLGYESHASSVEVVAGEVVGVQVELVQIRLQEVYYTSWHETGFFGCSWQVVIATGPWFFPGPQVPFPGNNRQFDYLVEEGTFTVLNELTWDETTAATGDSMSVFLSYTERTTSHWYCLVASPKPVYLRYDRPDIDADEGDCQDGSSQLPGGQPQVIPIEGQELTSRVNTGPSSLVPGFGMAFQQSFDIYFTIFYWGNAPEGWTALPDQ